jgi:ankyrin repeat protein
LAVSNYRWKTDHGEKPDAESIKALKIIKALLEAGADPNLYEPGHFYLDPPVYPICEADFHKDAVELLIKHGANVDFQTGGIDVDCPYNGSYYIDDLVDFLTHVNCKLTDKEKYELIKKAVDASKKLNERPGADLLYILQRNFLDGKIYYEIFKYLIEEKKVDPNIKLDNDSILYYLVGYGMEDKVHLKAIKLLLKHGADINILDDSGRTPLECIPSEDKDSIKFMRSLGAKTSKELKAESNKKPAPDKPTK